MKENFMCNWKYNSINLKVWDLYEVLNTSKLIICLLWVDDIVGYREVFY